MTFDAAGGMEGYAGAGDSDVRVAIVSTMRFPEFGVHVVRSFVAYHLAKGFDHIFLFFDDAEDTAAMVAKEARWHSRSKSRSAEPSE